MTASQDMHAAVQIPDSFCWTKIGAESGEGLAAIICRKELERQAGDGVFYWGVGNAVGPAVGELASGGVDPTVIFSKMRAAAAKIDREPEALCLWRAYKGRDGVIHRMPDHAIVTSRANKTPDSARRPHYALICRSARPLTPTDKGVIRFNNLVNYTTSRPLGYSQVTALVKHRSAGAEPGGPEYQIAMVANLVWPYFVQLLDPAVLPLDLGMKLGAAASELDLPGWLRYAQEVRASAIQDQVFPDESAAADGAAPANG